MILDLVPAPYRLLAVAGVLLAAAATGFAAGWKLEAQRSERRIAELKAEQAKAVAAAERAARQAVEAARAREAALTAQAERIIDEARKIADQARLDAAAADAARGSLLDAAARYAARRRACANPAAAGRGSPADASGDLLLDVLARTDAAAGQLAIHADAARAAGLACERLYESVRVAK